MSAEGDQVRAPPHALMLSALLAPQAPTAVHALQTPGLTIQRAEAGQPHLTATNSRAYAAKCKPSTPTCRLGCGHARCAARSSKDDAPAATSKVVAKCGV